MIWQEEVRGGFFDVRLAGLSGLDVMRAAIRGEGGVPPPIHHLTGMVPVEAGPGMAVFRMPATGWLRSAAGVFLGGSLAIVADAALGVAIQTGLPPATPYTTSELSMNFLRPATVGSGALVARGRLVHLGRRFGLSEASIEDSSGRLLAHGTSRCFIFDQITPVPGPPDLAPVDLPTHPTPDPYQREPQGEVWPQSVWDERSGLEVMKAAAAGELPRPPLAALTGMRPTAAEEGAMSWVLPATGWLCSPTGFIQGGVIAMLADVALGGSVATTLDRRTAYASVDLKVHYLRPVPPDGNELTARARVTHAGRNIAVASAEILNAAGKRVALATGSSMILPNRPASLAAAPADEAPA